MELGQRREFWQVSCSSIDAVLWTSFTVEELRRELAGFNVDPIGDARATPEVRYFAPAHRLCREPSDAAIHLADRLDRMHRDTVLWVRSLPPRALIATCLGDLQQSEHPIGALLWAVARDPRASMRMIESMLIWRAQSEGLRSLAFGRVELVPVG